jgi:hypothetical protein
MSKQNTVLPNVEAEPAGSDDDESEGEEEISKEVKPKKIISQRQQEHLAAIRTKAAEAKKKQSEITKKANYGDVAIYFATPPPRGNKRGKYRFHAQIYTGNQYGDTKWTTSVKDNYGSEFVYKNRPETPYTVYWFRIKDEYKS